MQLLSARRAGPSFHYRVHLDESKVGSDGAPDPAWVLALSWSDRPRGLGETAAQFAARLTAYEAMARREMRLLCQARLAELSPPIEAPLPGEGETF